MGVTELEHWPDDPLCEVDDYTNLVWIHSASEPGKFIVVSTTEDDFDYDEDEERFNTAREALTYMLAQRLKGYDVKPSDVAWLRRRAQEEVQP